MSYSLSHLIMSLAIKYNIQLFDTVHPLLCKLIGILITSYYVNALGYYTVHHRSIKDK